MLKTALAEEQPFPETPDVVLATTNARLVNPDIEIIQLSSTSGVGMVNGWRGLSRHCSS